MTIEEMIENLEKNIPLSEDWKEGRAQIEASLSLLITIVKELYAPTKAMDEYIKRLDSPKSYYERRIDGDLLNKRG